MAKHRRYSRKRKSQGRLHNYSRKMRGGVDTTPSNIDFETEIPPGQPSPDISFEDQSLNMSNLEGQSLNLSDLDVTTDSQEGNTTSETISSTDNLISGGRKRRYKGRLTLARQSKRKTKKNNKSRKIRKRKYYGGEGFTTQVTTNPIAYKKKEYYEMMELIDKSRQ
jgi:hypothetical protein